MHSCDSAGYASTLVMQCLRRIALSPSAIVARQLRLLPSLHSEAINTDDGSKGSTTGPSKRSSLSSYDMVIVGDGPVSSALACSIGKEKI